MITLDIGDLNISNLPTTLDICDTEEISIADLLKYKELKSELLTLDVKTTRLVKSIRESKSDDVYAVSAELEYLELQKTSISLSMISVLAINISQELDERIRLINQITPPSAKKLIEMYSRDILLS